MTRSGAAMRTRFNIASVRWSASSRATPAASNASET